MDERLRHLAKKVADKIDTEEKCAQEMLKPWLLGILVLICISTVLAFYYADDIRQNRQKAMAVESGAQAGQSRGNSGLMQKGSPLAKLTGFIPPWRRWDPDVITGATPIAASFSPAIGAVAPSVVGINTSGGVQAQGASGIIVHRRGYILTNHHVVKGAKNIVVSVSSGQMVRNYGAKIVDIRPELDLAIIKLMNTRAETFTPAPLGNSNGILVGQQVLAIGNPFGLAQSSSAGIISNTQRTLTAGNKVFRGLIQTDASINPGSSGGALVNTRGQVIGINTAIYSPTMSFSGIGFAIPINQAVSAFLPFIEMVKSPLVKRRAAITRRQARPANAMFDAGDSFRTAAGPSQQASPPKQSKKQCWLGVDVYPVDPAVAKMFDVPFSGGVLVNRVFTHSPAALASLARGDVIYRIDGRRVKDIEMLWSYLAQKKAGDQVDITVFRKGSKETFMAVLEPEPANVHSLLSNAPTGAAVGEIGLAPIAEISWIGIDIQPIEAGRATKKFGVDPNQRGVLVGEVEGIAAIESGLRPGDVIKMINNRPINNIEEFKNLIKRIDPSAGVVLDIVRQKRPFYITIKSSRRDFGAWQ